jgi:hypothetical protein
VNTGSILTIVAIVAVVILVISPYPLKWLERPAKNDDGRVSDSAEDENQSD